MRQRTDWRSVATKEEREAVRAAKAQLKWLRAIHRSQTRPYEMQIDAIKTRCVRRAKGLEEVS